MPLRDKMPSDGREGAGVGAGELLKNLDAGWFDIEALAGESAIEAATGAVESVAQDAEKNMTTLDHAADEQPVMGLDKADVDDVKVRLGRIRAHTEALVAAKKAEAKNRIEAVIASTPAPEPAVVSVQPPVPEAVSAQAPQPATSSESAPVPVTHAPDMSETLIEQSATPEVGPVGEFQTVEAGLESNLMLLQMTALELSDPNRAQFSPAMLEIKRVRLQQTLAGNVAALDRMYRLAEASGGALAVSVPLQEAHKSAMEMADVVQVVFQRFDRLTPDERKTLSQKVEEKRQQVTADINVFEAFRSTEPGAGEMLVEREDAIAEKSRELEQLSAQAEQEMQKIFAELMRMKESGGVLDADELAAYHKMLDESEVLNAFLHRLTSELQDTSNSEEFRNTVADYIHAFREGAKTQEGYARQLARHDAEHATGGTTAAVVGAGIAGLVAGMIAGRQPGKSSEKFAGERPDANEKPALSLLREQVVAHEKKMKQATTTGDAGMFDVELNGLIRAKESLLAQLTSTSGLTDGVLSERQKKEIGRLTVEIAKWKNEKEIRTETAKLKELEEKRQTILAELKAAEKGGNAEAIAAAQKNLAEVDGEIAKTKKRITALRSQQKGQDDMLDRDRGPASPVDLGAVGEGLATAAAEYVLDPAKLGNAALDAVISAVSGGGTGKGKG